MAVAVDGSSPVRWAAMVAANGTMTSASFTAPANSLLVWTIQTDGKVINWPGGITVADSGGLTWTLQVARTWGEATDGGSSFIYTAPQVTSAARTATLTSGNSNSSEQCSAKLYAVTGADISGTPVDTVGANNEGGSTTNNLTTASITPGADGLLFASDCDYKALGAFDASSDLTEDTAHYATHISVDSGYKTVSNGVAVTCNLNAGGTGAPQHKWCQIIVRAPAGGADPPPAFPGDDPIGLLYHQLGLC